MRMTEKIKKYWNTRKRLEKDLGREPFDEEMATEMEIEVEEAREWKKLELVSILKI